MDNSNSKLITLSFAAFSVVVGVTVSLLLGVFSTIPFIAKLMSSDLFRHGAPVAIGFVLFFILQFRQSTVQWMDEVIVEIRKVIWPSQKDMTAMVIAVLMMVVISSVVVTGFDMVSGFVLNKLISAGF